MVTNLSSTMTSLVRLLGTVVSRVSYYGDLEGDVQVCSDSGLVLVAEAFVHVLVHERGLSDTAARSSSG